MLVSIFFQFASPDHKVTHGIANCAAMLCPTSKANFPHFCPKANWSLSRPKAHQPNTVPTDILLSRTKEGTEDNAAARCNCDWRVFHCASPTARAIQRPAIERLYNAEYKARKMQLSSWVNTRSISYHNRMKSIKLPAKDSGHSAFSLTSHHCLLQHLLDGHGDCRFSHKLAHCRA